jgi:hypothetical protein
MTIVGLERCSGEIQAAAAGAEENAAVAKANAAVADANSKKASKALQTFLAQLNEKTDTIVLGTNPQPNVDTLAKSPELASAVASILAEKLDFTVLKSLSASGSELELLGLQSQARTVANDDRKNTLANVQRVSLNIRHKK